MSLTSAFEIGLIRPVIQGITDVLTAGISVNVIPETREPFINLPGLRGYWPMSAVDFLGNAKDHSGASSDLARVGSPQFGHGTGSYVQCGVGTDYLAGSASAQTITGLETWIEPAIRGLTVGVWVKVDVSPVANTGLVTKWGLATTRSYQLTWRADNSVLFGVTAAGTTATLVLSGVTGIGVWTYIVGRFTPSNELAVFVNQAKVVNTTSIPASIFTGTSIFEIGRVGATSPGILEAKFRDAFLCQAILTDVEIEDLRLSSLPAT